jgi:outer membrane protein assembly factor BamA
MTTLLTISILGASLTASAPGAEPASDGPQPADSAVYTAAQPLIEPFPILSYDSDTGFGYGGKLVVLNHLGGSESFDITLYGSTKGERWYRFAVSVPDRELRQGKVYPVAVDAVVDYDKWIASSFFGIGSGSPFAAREIYTKEVADATLTISRGFTTNVIGEATVRWSAVRASHLDPTGRLITMLPGPDARKVGQWSTVVSLRYDSRDDALEPTAGTVIAGTAERAFSGDQLFNRYSGAFQRYVPVFSGELAVRFLTQWVSGNISTPLIFPTLGGGNTLRGAIMDRFIDRGMAVVNAELRMPLWGRLGCVGGLDAGKVWARVDDLDMARWSISPVVGLRVRMQTFVVRLDVGFGHETTGVYVNFGHLF